MRVRQARPADAPEVAAGFADRVRWLDIGLPATLGV
jgi:hypothetical protein